MKKVKIRNYPMVNPTPVVIVGAQADKKPNYATVGAFGVVCMKPVFYISLKSTHLTTAGVKENGYFSVNVPSTDMLQKTDYCGIVSGKTADKTGLFSCFYDDAGNAPMIAEAPMNYLCRVFKTVSVYDFDVFFGEITATFIKEDCLTDGKPDPVKIAPLFLMGSHYYGIGEPSGGVFQEGTKAEMPLTGFQDIHTK